MMKIIQFLECINVIQKQISNQLFILLKNSSIISIEITKVKQFQWGLIIQKFLNEIVHLHQEEVLNLKNKNQKIF